MPSWVSSDCWPSGRLRTPANHHLFQNVAARSDLLALRQEAPTGGRRVLGIGSRALPGAVAQLAASYLFLHVIRQRTPKPQRLQPRRPFLHAGERHRHQAALLRLQPRLPVGRGDVPNVCDRRAADVRRRLKAPTHHQQLAPGGAEAHHRCRLVADDGRQRRQVTSAVGIHLEESPDLIL